MYSASDCILLKHKYISVISPPLIIWQPQINEPLTGCFVCIVSVPISTCICYLIKSFSKDFQKQQMHVSTSITSDPANGDALGCSRLHALLVWVWEMPQAWLHRTGAVCPAAPELCWNIKGGNQKDHWSRGLDTTSELTPDLCQVAMCLKHVYAMWRKTGKVLLKKTDVEIYFHTLGERSHLTVSKECKRKLM